MQSQLLSKTRFPSLLSQTLEALQDPLYCRDKIDDLVASILQNISFFHKVIEAPIRLEDIIQLTKSFFVYEKHTYGSVLIRDKEPAEKFYIILKGTAEKIGQRPYNEIEKELKTKGKKVPEAKRVVFPVSPVISTHSGFWKPSKISKITSMKEFPRQKTPNCFVTKIDVIDELLENNGNKSNTDASIPNQRRGCLKLDEAYSLKDLDNVTPQHPDPSDPLFGVPNELLKLKDGVKSKVFTRSGVKTEPDLDKIISEGKEHNEKKPEEEETPIFLHRKRPFQRKKIVKAFTRFLEDVVEKNTGLKERCFYGSVNRVIKTNTFTPGQYFGENFYKLPKSKENTIVAVSSEELHVLTITRENFRRVLNELYTKAHEKTRFFQETFPALSEEMLRMFSRYFTMQNFKKGDVIYSQKDLARELYILQHGDVTLLKGIEESSKKVSRFSPLGTPKSSRKKEHLVASIIRNQFFGEEIVLGVAERQYSAIAKSSDTVVHVLDISNCQKIKREFPELFKTLRVQAVERFLWRNKRVEEIREQQQKAEGTFSTIIKNFYAPTPQSQTPRGAVTGRVTPRAVGGLLDYSSEVSENVNSCQMNSNASGDDEQRKTLSIYKAKFSRKTAKVLKKAGVEARSSDSKRRLGEKVSELLVDKASTDDIVGINVRRELEESKAKVRLPRLTLNIDSKSKNSPTVSRTSEPNLKEVNGLFISNFTDRTYDSPRFNNCTSPCTSYRVETPRSDRGEVGMSRIRKLLKGVCTGNTSRSSFLKVKEKPILT